MEIIPGGRFDTFDLDLFRRYVPEPENFQDTHSIYFQMPAQHGFIGLALFLVLGFLALRTASWVIRNAKDIPELDGVRILTANAQTILVGFAVGGAFLGMAYFGLYYHILAIVLLAQVLGAVHLRDNSAQETPSQSDDRMPMS